MIDLPATVIQKLNAFAAVRAFRAGARSGRAFDRAYAAGRVGSTLREARMARRIAQSHPAGQAGVTAGVHAAATRRRSLSSFREGLRSSRGVSNRLVIRTALSRRLPVPVSMRAGYLVGAARNRFVRDATVRGGGYYRRTPA